MHETSHGSVKQHSCYHVCLVSSSTSHGDISGPSYGSVSCRWPHDFKIEALSCPEQTAHNNIPFLQLFIPSSLFCLVAQALEMIWMHDYFPHLRLIIGILSYYCINNNQYPIYCSNIHLYFPQYNVTSTHSVKKLSYNKTNKSNSLGV